MTGRFQDPGVCPVCGAAHSGCTPAVEVVQLPARDAAIAAASPAPDPRLEPAGAIPVGGEAGAAAPLGDACDEAPFTTATYRGRKRRGPG